MPGSERRMRGKKKRLLRFSPCLCVSVLKRLLSRTCSQLLHHREHKLTIAIVQVVGIAAELSEETDLVLAPLWKVLSVLGIGVVVGEKLCQSNVHCRRYFG